MAEETNRELVLRYFVATHNTPWNPDVIAELCSPAFGERQREWLVMEHAAFPDIAATVEDVVAGDDKVVLRHVLRGTHRDDFRTPLGTLAASGNRIEVPAIFLYHVSDGKIVAGWGAFDWLTVARQLGALPETR